MESREPLEDDVMVLVVPELEVEVSQLPKLVLRESIAAIAALVSNVGSVDTPSPEGRPKSLGEDDVERTVLAA